LKILEQNRAPNPRRVRIFLAEKGIAVLYEQVDIMKLEHRTPGFAELNPMRQVPVLVLDDGSVIAESVAICRYFEEEQPEPPLFGTGARERAIVEMWNRRMELGLFYRVAQCFRHAHPAMAQLEMPQVKDWGEANRPRAVEMLEWMDKELSGRRFIAGDRYSIADITALVAVDFMSAARIERPPQLKNLERWHSEVSSRPSAKA
jgi:glutathione S-transferase